jgi:hypothetical protein
MSEAAVLPPPTEVEGAQWIELEEFTDVDPVVPDASAEDDFIELDSTSISFDSQDSMRFGPRAYTREQAEVIQLATQNRRPLRVAALPLDDE